jgi:exosortase
LAVQIRMVSPPVVGGPEAFHESGNRLLFIAKATMWIKGPSNLEFMLQGQPKCSAYVNSTIEESAYRLFGTGIATRLVRRRGKSLVRTAANPAIDSRDAINLDRDCLLRLVFLAVLLGLLYHDLVADLVKQWLHDPNYSHGPFVLLFCTYILWKRRKHFAAQPEKPSSLGLGIIVGALGLLIVGVLGAELFLSRASLLFLLAGLILYFRGWKFFREALFPWAMLFLMIPLPFIIFNRIALPLQFQAARLASALLGLTGVPVLREGNIIQLPSLTLEVAEACSGLRSLISLITLGLFYGYLMEPRASRRALLALTAIPTAVIANSLRIMGSGILGEYWSPNKAEGFFHIFSGWLIFVVSLCLLMAFHAALSSPNRHTRARRALCLD